MKIVNRRQFLALPENTVFSKYEPCVFGELMIKGESLANDFYAQEIGDAIFCSGSSDRVDKLGASERDGASLPMDFDCPGRDGLFDDDQMFAVWEPEDVRKLIARLQECV